MLNESSNKVNCDNDEIHLLDFVIIILKYSRMICYFSAAVAMIVFLVLVILPKQYKATATILPPQQNMNLTSQLLDSLGISSSLSGGGSGGGLGGMAMSFLGLKSAGDLYVGILKGETIFDRMIQRFDLKNYYRSGLTSHKSTKKPPIEDIRKELGNYADISVGKDGLIQIDVIDKDPQRAADMANAFGEELDHLLQEISTKDAENQLSFLEKQRVQSGINLAKAEEAVRHFSETKNVIQLDAQTKGMIEYIANLRATIDVKEVEVKVLQQQATPVNFDLVRLETEVRGLKDKLRAAETKLDNCVGDVCLPTSTLPALGLEYLRLYREVKFQNNIYQLYCKLGEMARLDVARTVPTILFVNRAKPAEKKSKPKRATIAILAFIGTLFISVFMAFGLEYWKNNFKSEKQRIDAIKEGIRQWRQDANSFRFLFKRNKSQIDH